MTDAEAEQEAKRLARLIELSPHNFGHLAAALKSAYAKGAADERERVLLEFAGWKKDGTE
jgi:hypothetical protein